MKGALRMYELAYILTSVLSSDQISEVVSKITAAIKNAGGDVREVNQWGMQRLAYPVSKKRNGYYVNVYFEGPGTVVARLERLLSIDDHVLRYLVLAMDKQMLYAYHVKKRTELMIAASEAHNGENGAEITEAAETTETVETVLPEIRPVGGQPHIDYKDTSFLKRFINEQGKMLPRRVTDVSARRQRAISRAIKQARHLALLPYVADSVR